MKLAPELLNVWFNVTFDIEDAASTIAPTAKSIGIEREMQIVGLQSEGVPFPD